MKTTKCLCLVLCAVACASAIGNDDIDVLFSRLKNYHASNISLDEVESILKSQRKDGTWDGFKYNTKNHMPIGHIENTRKLAEGFDRYCEENNKTERAVCGEIKEKVAKSLTFWFDNKDKFVSDNWWMNEIGLQQEMAPIYFLMGDKLSENLRKSIINTFQEKPSRSSTNRAWISENVIARGIWERREDLIKLGLNELEVTMHETLQEGPQPDHSFFIHGNQLYNGCYGRSALYTAALWAAFTHGLNFAYKEKSIRDMAAFALEGNRWMMWKGMVDAMTLGRDISLVSKNKESKGYADIISYLKTADPQHRSEYDAWLRDIKGDEHQKGCHYFWRGEIMVCKSKSSYVSLKLSSKKTVGAEFLNRENRRGLWLGTGVLSVYTHPDDFKNIYPLWDWSKLPGVTSYGESEMKEKRVTNQANFVGGIDEGNFGVAVMALARPNLSAKKSWFFLDGNVVALGADISGSHSTGITTTLDQRLAHGKVSADKKSFDEGTVSDVRSLWHDGIGYRILDGQTMKASIENRDGNWKNIGTSKGDEHGKVLTLWLSHGTEIKGASYAYSVSLEKNKSAFLKKKKADVAVVRNDGGAQVIFDERKKILMGGFFKKDSVQTKSMSVSFDNPAVFMLKRDGDECLLKIADPLKTAKEISVGMKYKNKSKREVSENFSVRFDHSDAKHSLRQIYVACPAGF